MTRSSLRLGIWTVVMMTLGMSLGVALTVKTGVAPVVPVPIPLEVAAPTQPGQVGAMGWVEDKEAVAAYLANRPMQSFADTPAYKETTATPDHVYLWESAKDALGANLPANDQGQVGCCVAAGTKGAVDHLQCIQMVAAKKAGRPPPEFKPVSIEVIYAGSRVEIGGGKIRGDGSVGAWALQYCEKEGVVAMAKYASVDLSSYSQTRCRAWGNSGVPADITQIAKAHPILDGVQVKSADEAEAALANGYTITVASNQGFANQSQRDKDGFLKASGTWGHQMCVLGYQKGARPGFLIWNSWGPSWVGGPKGAGDPPDGSFWADRATADRMFKAGDTWAYSTLKGFPSRKPDAFIRGPRQRFAPDTMFALAF